ncbi:RDD family protein [Hyphomicrobium sp.]|uniref:RDD family protein n=1 Tax=Hyphomicrobium sp. TaxID=82 RepID=UPI0025B90004|nr:RDD family protein [Hyphomicrobium sp.]MCC7252345.1 RDD family protein [Hyphomicrobium sp.]
MVETSQSSRPPAESRARLWERGVATAVDVLIINLVMALIGLALVEVTGGRVRVASTIFNVVNCTSSESVPAGLALPDDFEAASARSCTWSVLGIAHDWKLVVTERTAAGQDSSDVRQITLATDETWRPARPFYLDDLILVILAPYLILLEWWFGATIGKYVVGIRTKLLDGATLTLPAATKRNVIKLIVLAAGAGEIFFRRLPTTDTQVFNLKLVTSHGIDHLGALADVLQLLQLAYVISAVVLAVRHRRLLHDQWAGTDVVRPVNATTDLARD